MEEHLTVGQVAELADVTVRTLHHYDEIRLVQPSARTAAGYRAYSAADVERLREVLAYRRLGFGLREIADLVDDPATDAVGHLRRLRGLLLEQRDRADAMAAAIDTELEARAMGIRTTPAEQLKVFGARLYDVIGAAYPATRRTEPRIAARIWEALGDARTVLNVGAGTGSYEPPDREVTAVEPSAVMRAQRPDGAAPCVAGDAESLPFDDQSFDAAMAVSTLHHWRDPIAGLREMRRVARRVVVLTYDAGWHQRFWLSRDYLPEFADLVAGMPSLADMARAIGGDAEPVLIPWDCADGFFEAYWRRPEAYLEEHVRRAVSVWTRVGPEAEERAVRALREDLASGRWADRNRDLVALNAAELGLRLLVCPVPAVSSNEAREMTRSRDAATSVRLIPPAVNVHCARPPGGGSMLAVARRGVAAMILPTVRDPRFMTIRRGGTLTDSDHRLLALWAASCAEHVLHLFESAYPEDPRPRQAIEHARAWTRGEVKMMASRAAGGHAMGAARDKRGAARHAAYAAGQAGAVAHVADHELGAAAYAIKAVRAAAPDGEVESAGRLECRWQRDQLPAAIRQLVLDDQRLRNDICWSVFDC